ncbi:HipA domain-containing protein [Bifidobacterium sp. ESL0682]|uniref:HipA domain-containing protein n=1 Tax=Bifidobacterium sp. ESL0682 TaxID=2983212 RepID=UPI0023F853D9|nr:HipA domain-containing protein [Bifidobacterium sp. ESL0682]WEV41600.1 HipA domain-containing protein [Bifidobacterium sp. ESL0682]
MAKRTLDVYMDGTFVGSLAMSTEGRLTFDYEERYRTSSRATPLSLSMPLTKKSYGNRSVLPFLQGLLPDNSEALASMASTYQVSASSPFSLLQYVGHDVAGALQIVEPGGVSEDAQANRTRPIQAMDDTQLSQLLKNTITMYEHGARVSNKQRMSLAGAQAKVAVTRTDDGRWCIPERGVPTTHIFKPLLASDMMLPDMDIVEFFCQKVVESAGIPAAKTDLWQSPDGDVRALVSTRYDRKRNIDGTWSRLHQEDLCQAMSVSPSKKYQRNDGGPGVGQVAQLLRTRVTPEYAQQVAADFLRALSVNIALLNTDAHAKNYSLLLERDSVQLAPMYDVLSVAPFLKDGAVPLSSMKIGKTYDMRQMFPETVVAEGIRLGIPSAKSESIVQDAVHGLRVALPETAERLSPMDRDGVISRTVEGITRDSALLRQ